MWDVIDAEPRAGIQLSESLSMMPAASVSALVFAHKQSEYFQVGPIAKDQMESYAKRKKMDLEVCEKWLAPNLAYDRDA
jgi:5-methyltetrahydrofolate--homocysteine methyltransferase